MNLILMPIAVSLAGVILLAIAVVVGGAMLLFRTSAHIGRKLLVYSTFSLTVGVVCCWVGFALMMPLLFLELNGKPIFLPIRFANLIFPPSVVLFCVSGPCGMVVGALLAHRTLARRGTPRDGP